MLDDVHVIGVRADFVETLPQEIPSTPMPGREPHSGSGMNTFPRASDLPKDKRSWFNFFDFIDADRKPFDRDPEMEIVNIGEIPQVFFSKRVKARQTKPLDDDGGSELSADSKSANSRLDQESSKFGHEKSHICYLGAASGVGPTQIRIANERIAELEEKLSYYADKPDELSQVRLFYDQTYKTLAEDMQYEWDTISRRIRTLKHHAVDLKEKENRHIDDDTLQSGPDSEVHPESTDHQDDVSFVNTFHIHCPKLFYNNASRNVSHPSWLQLILDCIQVLLR
jgi:hypothetical protein